jgi:hypothetical protein
MSTDLEVDIAFWIDFVAKVVVVALVVGVIWWLYAVGLSALKASGDAYRERTIHECMQAFEYSQAQCAFIIDHPNLKVH